VTTLLEHETEILGALGNMQENSARREKETLWMRRKSLRTKDERCGCMSGEKLENRLTVAAVVLRALCVDPDGVRVVYI